MPRIQASYSHSLQQLKIPLSTKVSIPRGLFEQHPYYVPDSVGRITALVAPLDDPIETKLRTRQPGSASNVVVDYIGPPYYRQDNLPQQLSLLLEYEEEYSSEELMELVERDNELVGRLNEYIDGHDTLKEIVAKFSTPVDAHKAIYYVLNKAMSNPNPESVRRLEVLIYSYWSSPHSNVANTLDPFYRLCISISHTNGTAIEMTALLSRCATKLVQTFHLDGFPEKLVPAYCRALLSLGAYDDLMDLLLSLWTAGFSPGIELVMEFVKASYDANPSSTSASLGLFRPYFTSKLLPPIGYSIVLKRYCTTIEEVYCLLDLCIASDTNVASLHANAQLFVKKAYEVCINEGLDSVVARANAEQVASRIRKAVSVD
ncbi:hypothetical protein V1512DRAFT_252150 [Lipomyces arxii]|uniref:uncharacterized protein n=1 Tax=Lipomyces arxii TaxID=56418 RepID=UPI0034CEECB7